MLIAELTTETEYKTLIADLKAERVKPIAVGTDTCPWHTERKLGFWGEWQYHVSDREIYAITLHHCPTCGKLFYQDGLADEHNVA